MAYGQDLTIDISWVERVRLLRLSGELDIASGPSLEACLILDPTSDMVLDVSELSFMDASGIGVLVRGERRARAAGVKLTVCGPRGVVARVLEIAGVDRFLTIER